MDCVRERNGIDPSSLTLCSSSESPRLGSLQSSRSEDGEYPVLALDTRTQSLAMKTGELPASSQTLLDTSSPRSQIVKSSGLGHGFQSR